MLNEKQRNNVRIVKEKIADYIDEPRFVPPIGFAHLHSCSLRCTVYFEERMDQRLASSIHLGRQRSRRSHLHRPQPLPHGRQPRLRRIEPILNSTAAPNNSTNPISRTSDCLAVRGFFFVTYSELNQIRQLSSALLSIFKATEKRQVSVVDFERTSGKGRHIQPTACHPTSVLRLPSCLHVCQKQLVGH